MFAHVVVARFNPNGVVDDAVHDRVGVNPGAEALVAVLLLILDAEDRRRFAAAALHQLQQPLVNDQQREGRILAEEPPGPAGVSCTATQASSRSGMRT